MIQFLEIPAKNIRLLQLSPGEFLFVAIKREMVHTKCINENQHYALWLLMALTNYWVCNKKVVVLAALIAGCCDLEVYLLICPYR